MIRQYLQKRRNAGLLLAEEAAWTQGFHDACDALRSDTVYYDVADASFIKADAIETAANYVESYDH